MNQRVMFFVSLVCIAQLGVTVVRNFWSSETRRVQHYNLSRLSRAENTETSPNSKSASRKPSANRDVQNSTKLSDSRAGQTIRETDSPAGNAEVAATKQLLPTFSKRRVDSESVGAIALRRDPFIPFFSNRQTSEQDSTKTLLEYEVSELRITAVIRDAQGNTAASVEAPNGRDFIVRIGSPIGSRGGQVVDISQSGVSIAEVPTSGTGGPSESIRVLRLRSTPTS